MYRGLGVLTEGREATGQHGATEDERRQVPPSWRGVVLAGCAMSCRRKNRNDVAAGELSQRRGLFRGTPVRRIPGHIDRAHGSRRPARPRRGDGAVVWFVSVVLYDVAVLGIASLLRSGPASRLLITAVLVNPADAARTVALMAVEGTAAFGAASLALLRFTGGAGSAMVLASASLILWIAVPLLLAARRLARADLYSVFRFRVAASFVRGPWLLGPSLVRGPWSLVWVSIRSACGPN